MFESIFKILLKKTNYYSLYCLKKKSALVDYAWFESFEKKESIDANGKPIPWFTYPAIDFLSTSERLNKDMLIFEYGAGNSTFWWSERVKQVVTCEHNYDWYCKLNSMAKSNIEMHYEELEKGYSKKILKYSNQFHIIVVDGRQRVDCVHNSLKALRKDGIIIFDNANRARYIDAVNFLLNRSFKRLDFWGMAPICTFKSCTSIFYRNRNCLNI